jgi:hypothetical protein
MTNIAGRGSVVLVVWLTLLGSASAANFWALTQDQHLVRFTSAAPGTIVADLPVTGLPAGERLIAIRTMSTGIFLGVSSSGHSYSIDRHTGAVTLLPTQGSGHVAVPSGNQFGLTDFGVAILVSDTGQVILINSGLWDSSENGAWTPIGHWVAIAWYQTLAPTVQLHQFMIDSNTDMLLRNSSAFFLAQSISPVGPLGVDTPGLYTIDQASGHATLIGAIGAGPIISFSIDKQGLPILTQVPAPSAPGSVIQWPESNSSIEFSLRRTGDDVVAADYNFTTESIGTGAEFATAGQDYVPVSTIVHFEPGETEKRASIQVLDDNIRENNERFEVRLIENVANVRDAQQLVSIVDDDNKPPVLTITSPASLQLSTESDKIDLAGTVTDEDAGFFVIVIDKTIKPVTLVGGQMPTSPWSVTNVPLRMGRNVFEVDAVDRFGAQTSTTVEVWRQERIDQTFVFAEGATGGFFHTDLLFANPNFDDLSVTIDFLREDGVVVQAALRLFKMGRATLDVGKILGLEATAVAAVVHSTNNYPIVAERTMTWDQQGYGASGEKGASALSTTWLFAEGSQGFFKTFLLLVNPQTTSNDVTVRFLLESGAPLTKTYTMGPHQRLTVDGAAIPELQNQSFGMEVTFAQPGMAERSMYFGDSPLWTGGHESAGAPAAASDWFLAEGATGPFFETFLLLANPGNEPADVQMTYFPSTGVPVTRTRQVPANGRLTVNLEFEHPSLANAAIATHVTSSKPIVVERSQYWPYTPDQWYEAHNSFGQTAPGLHWGLAEGRVGGPREYQTYILLANPGAVPANVTVRFLTDGGRPVVTKTYTVPPTSRFNLPVDITTVPEIADTPFGATFGVDIYADVPIMVERSMYSNAIGQIWAAGTNATATRLP